MLLTSNTRQFKIGYMAASKLFLNYFQKRVDKKVKGVYSPTQVDAKSFAAIIYSINSVTKFNAERHHKRT